jgi:hypothetical protein
VRRVAAFGVLILPVVLWVAMDAWVGTLLDTWSRTGQQLSFVQRVAVALDSWVVRYLSFMILVVVFLAPVWALVVCLVAGVLPVHERSATGLLGWSAASFVFGCAGVAALFVPDVRSRLGLSTALNWSGFVAGSIAVGCAYALQKARRARRYSEWHPAWVFGATAAAQSWLLPLGALVPPAVWTLAHLADRAAPPNDELQRTRPAQAMEPRR